ncbi:uncharacterized protein LOC130432405 [Triplophysa dalaica]|uniref:uncharacterized protein LOC130432405 n=1 Tax=Triplophysa dalaica TaxID=1582913 RepID=UPI0024DFAEF1|nr:uncharacterized protein LOC130432405 [Triplophysa dalaica]
MSETPVINDASTDRNPSAPTSASHCSSSGSDSVADSPASSRGRQLRRSAPRKAKIRGDTPSLVPERRPPPSPASSYTSTHNTIPAIHKWTVQGLRLALSNADIEFHRRMTKAELYCLYASSLADTAPPKSAPQRSTDKPGTARGSPYSRPGQSTNAARRGRPPATRHSRPSASAGTATDLPDASNRPVEVFQQLVPLAVGQLQPPANTTPAVNTAGRPRNVGSPALGAPVLSHPFPAPGSWPTAPPSTTSARLPQLAMQVPVISHFTAPLEAAASASMAPLAAQAAAIPSLLSLPQSRSGFTLATATAMPVPINAPALEPPPVPGNIRSQILAGADTDLYLLLSPLSPPSNERQITYGDLSLTLKNQSPNHTRTLSFPEFIVAFSRYTDVICTAFPHRRRELGDYLAIVAELALSYGGAHFYTYHRLFSAKCAIRIAQWNQCPYWGALDTELHNRVFLGVRNITCAVCRSVAHTTLDCPLVTPSLPPRSASPPQSTCSVPRLPTRPVHQTQGQPGNLEACRNFNAGRCVRQRCRFLHVCSFCSGAHARIVCPLSQTQNKKLKNYLSTPVNISCLSSELSLHPDFQFTDYLLTGLSNGFNPGVVSLPSHSLICPNLQSALAEPESVDFLIKKEIDANFIIGPFDAPPFPAFRISPIGIATRKFSGKKRLIFDLSSPHGSTFPSINSLIPIEEFSLHYHNIDQAITLIKHAGHGAWLAKVDITSAFKVMPIHPDFWHLFGIRWRNKFYFSVRLTFGCRSSPKIFDMLSEAICWILSNNYAIPYLIHLLDDFLIISSPDSFPAAHLAKVQQVFKNLGVPLAPDKTSGPSTSIEFLGIKLDSLKFQASLPKEKIDRTILIASSLLSNPLCSKRELLSVLGHLNFAMRIIPQGRPFVSHLLSLASSAHALEDSLSISSSCLDELSLWIKFLRQWNGLSFFYSDMASSPVDIRLFTDAAPSVGFGGFYQGRWFASTWPPQVLEIPYALASSALFELYPLVVAASLWGKEWSASSIIVHCDNEATVHCINKGRSHSPAIMPFLRRLIWISACDQFILTAKHIPGSKNQIADALSRFAFQKFRLLAPEADPLPTPVPPYSELIFQLTTP